MKHQYITLLFLCFTQLLSATPRISIITSLYDGDEFIQGFMEDIVQQTIFDQCELIIINAHSPGNEEPIIKEYMKQYPNIIYVELAKDPGIYAVWNLGIRMARSQYITNANVDDRLAYDCYELHAQALDEHPEIDLVYSHFYETSRPNEIFYQNTAEMYLVFPEFKPHYVYKNIPNNHPMWRKSMHAKYGYFDESYKIAGDIEMWSRAVYYGSKFMLVDKILGLMYKNPKGLSTNPEKQEIIKTETDRALSKYMDLFEPYLSSGSWKP